MGAKTKMINEYRYEFENEYGERWIFEFDRLSGRSFLRGEDVDWKEYEVVGGAVTLVLSKEEQTWLLESWNKCMHAMMKGVRPSLKFKLTKEQSEAVRDAMYMAETFTISPKKKDFLRSICEDYIAHAKANSEKGVED